MSFLGFFKKLVFFVVMMAIAISLRYCSTNPAYLVIRLLHSALLLKHSIVPDPARSTLSADYRFFENLFRLKPPPKSDRSVDPYCEKIRTQLLIDTLIPKPHKLNSKLTFYKVNKFCLQYGCNRLGKTFAVTYKSFHFFSLLLKFFVFDFEHLYISHGLAIFRWQSTREIYKRSKSNTKKSKSKLKKLKFLQVTANFLLNLVPLHCATTNTADSASTTHHYHAFCRPSAMMRSFF